MREKDVQRFNERAAGYEGSRMQAAFFAPVQRAVLDLLVSLDPSPVRLLDVGCGTGALLRQAADRFANAELHGVDPAPEMVKVARELGEANPRLHVFEAPVQQLPFSDGYFDLATSTLSFHHWGDQTQGLREIARVLRPGGALVLTDTFAISWKRALHFLARTRDRFHTESEVEQMLSGAGLKVIGWTVVFRVTRSPAVWAVSARKAVD